MPPAPEKVREYVGGLLHITSSVHTAAPIFSLPLTEDQRERAMEYRIVTTDGELYHYGVKGMRWGVRKQEAKVARSRSKARKFENKLKRDRGYDNNIIGRSFNDRRRGRLAAINRKLDNREAKLAYMKNKSSANRRRLSDTRSERLLKNVGAKAIGNTNRTEGQYQRHRKAGKSAAQAALIAGGTLVAWRVATNAVSNSGKQAAMNMMRDAIEDMKYKY